MDPVPAPPVGSAFVSLAAPNITRPQLRADMPLLWRSVGRLQVGDGPVTIDDATAGLYRWLQRLDGLHTWAELDQLLDAAGDPTPAQAARAVRTLVACGALDDAATMPSHWRWTDAAGRYRELGDLAAAAHVYGDPHQARRVLDRRHGLRVAVLGDGAVAEVTRRLLGSSGMRRDDHGAQACILADPSFPDVFDEPSAADYDRPHLPISVFGERALVGPLVLPGVTSCLRCRHLHRLDADPDWSIVSLQLSAAARRVPVPPIDRLLAHLAATRALLMLRQWVDDPDRPQLWADFAWEVWLPAGLVRRVERPPHPLCGCRWATTAPE